jgi:hypothetical protein
MAPPISCEENVLHYTPDDTSKHYYRTVIWRSYIFKENYNTTCAAGLINGGFNGRNKLVLWKMHYEKYAVYVTKFIIWHPSLGFCNL